MKRILTLAACPTFAMPGQGEFLRQTQKFATSSGPVNITPIYHASTLIEAALAFRPKIVIPYHYGTSDVTIFQKKLEGSGIEVRLLNRYANKKS